MLNAFGSAYAMLFDKPEDASSVRFSGLGPDLEGGGLEPVSPIGGAATDSVPLAALLQRPHDT